MGSPHPRAEDELFFLRAPPLVPGRGASNNRTSPPNVNSSSNNPVATGSKITPMPFIASTNSSIANLLSEPLNKSRS
jgi:hypothetical protein